MVGGGGGSGTPKASGPDITEVFPGGGGAGGVLNVSNLPLSSNISFNINIGEGGSRGNDGGQTTFSDTNNIISYTAGGGGRGAGDFYAPSAGSGGSSGGVFWLSDAIPLGPNPYSSPYLNVVQCITTGNTSNNLHNNGGYAYPGTIHRLAAGGGGAGGVGSQGGGGANGNGAGGAGVSPSNPVFGTDIYGMGGYSPHYYVGLADFPYTSYVNGYPANPNNNTTNPSNTGNGGSFGGFSGICMVAFKAIDFPLETYQ